MIISNKAAKKARIHREVRSDAVLAMTTKMQVLMVFGFRVARSIVKPDCIVFAILHVVALYYRYLQDSSNTQHLYKRARYTFDTSPELQLGS